MIITESHNDFVILAWLGTNTDPGSPVLPYRDPGSFYVEVCRSVRKSASFYSCKNRKTMIRYHNSVDGLSLYGSFRLPHPRGTQNPERRYAPCLS